jgi:hypothetical protein
MCENATKTAAELMAAIEPTLQSLLTFTGLASTPQGEAAVAAYNAALTALQNWQSGTAAENVIALIGDFQTVFATLPVPEEVSTLVDLISAGVIVVIRVVTGNSPAPAASVMEAVAAGATPEAAQKAHEAHQIAEATAEVQKLVPEFKPSVWKSILPGHSPADQYRKAWKQAVEKGGFPETMAA